MATEAQQILGELRLIRTDLEFIKDHMVDVDTILTPEEEERLDESLDDLKQGRTTSLENFEKEMKKECFK